MREDGRFQVGSGRQVSFQDQYREVIGQLRLVDMEFDGAEQGSTQDLGIRGGFG
jgi:hypothetical protein